MTERDGMLTGFTIGVTAYRRAEDQVSAFTRRGARVVHAPVLRIAPAAEDETLIADTRTIIAARPDRVILNTAYGVRRWLDAADAAGLLEELHEVLDHATLMLRGSKTQGGARAAGLNDANAIEGEFTVQLVDQLLHELEGGAAISCVAMQSHGYIDEAQLARLRAAGLQVLSVEPYRWVAEEDLAAVDRLIEQSIAGSIDALTFTSAPVVDALLNRADQIGRSDALTRALVGGEVVAAAVGPVTAGPLEDLGVTPVIPDRHRLGALVRELSDHLVRQRTAPLR